MKILFPFVLIVILFFMSCLNKTNSLMGKKYIFQDDYGSMSIEFTSKKECIYIHNLKACGMDTIFQKVRIKCFYNLNGNIITLCNPNPVDTLKSKGYIKVPEEELKKCFYMNQYIIDPNSIYENRIGLIGIRTPQNNAFYIGYLNYIDKEKLLYQDSLIYYQKSFIMNNQPQGFNISLLKEGCIANRHFTDSCRLNMIRQGKVPANIIINMDNTE